MDVICEKCGAIYELDSTQIPGDSVRVKCSSCNHLFRVFKPTTQQSNHFSSSEHIGFTAEKPWFVRYPDGVIAKVPDLATLQRWIVQKKISQQAAISRDESHWLPATDQPELAPFFLLLQQATQSKNASTLQIEKINKLPPGKTLEFGYLTEDSPNQATEFEVLGVQEFSSKGAEQATEFDMMGASESSVRSFQAKGSKSHDSRNSEPSISTSSQTGKALAHSSGEWFQGPNLRQTANQKNQKRSQPTYKSDLDSDEPRRDFSTDEDPYGDFDDLDDIKPPSQPGRWIFFLGFLFLIFAGGLYLINPKIYSILFVKVGISEALPDAEMAVKKSDEYKLQFTQDSLAKAEEQLNKAKAIQEEGFPTLSAKYILLTLSRYEYLGFKELALAQKIEQLQGQLKTSKKSKGAKEPTKAKKNSPERKKRQALLRAIEEKQSEFSKIRTEQWNNAKNALASLYQKHAQHPIVRLTQLQFYGLSPQTPESYKNLNSELLNNPNAKELKDEILSIELKMAVRKKEHDRSNKLFESLLSRNPKNRYLQFLHIRSLIDQQQQMKALNVLNDILQQSEKHPLATLLRSVLLKPKKKSPAKKVKPVKADPKKAKEKKKEAPTKRSKPASIGYKALYTQARRSFRRERFGQAIRLYKSALKKSKTAPAYAGLGMSYLEQGLLSSAERSFKKALTMTSRIPDAYTGLASLNRRRGNKKKTRYYYERFLQVFGKNRRYRREASEIRSILKNLNR